MHISINIDTSNAAFEDFDAPQVIAILHEMAEKMTQYNFAHSYAMDYPKVRDINGNTVGSIKVTE